MNVLLERQAFRESNARTYARSLGLSWARASGSRVWTLEGRSYLDFLAGAGTLALGHNPPQIRDALKAMLDEEAPLHTLDIATPTKDLFVEALFQTLPKQWGQDGKVQFCGPTGADAVEAALKLAKTATGRSGVIAFTGAYHGQTHGALALMGNIATKSPVAGLMPDVHFFPYPYPYRCPFGMGAAGTHAQIHWLRHALTSPESGIPRPACVIIEAVQGEGGVVPAPAEFLQALRTVTEELGILLILDEIQSGLGRTGDMWSFEPSGISPDIILTSKAIGGGLPLALMLYQKKWDVWSPGAHTGTFRGNQMAMAAGLIVLETLKSPGFLESVRRKGQVLGGALQQLAQKHRWLGEVRGRGLMWGVEIIDTSQKADALGSHPPHGLLAQRLRQLCLESGLILELGGAQGATLRFLPPLNTPDSELELAIGIVTRCIEQLSREGV